MRSSPSWRFPEGIQEESLTALFVRDATGMDVNVAAGVAVPPHLEGELPDRSALLDPAGRTATEAAWADWWLAVIAHEVRMHQGADDSVGPRIPPRHSAEWMRQRAAEHRAVFDPPEFHALADRPGLRTAVSATFAEATRWANAQRRALLRPPTGRHSQFDYEMIREVAEQTARRHRVNPATVRACAIVLPVAGNWWHRFAPGAVLCSVHAARDSATAMALLTEAFESGLTG